MIHRILERGRNQMKISDGTFSPCDINIAHLSKFAVNFNLIISKPKCIVISTDRFCSVVARGTSHFYSFSLVLSSLI